MNLSYQCVNQSRDVSKRKQAACSLCPHTTDFCDLKVWGFVPPADKQLVLPQRTSAGCSLIEFGSEAVYLVDNVIEHIRTSVLKIPHLQSDTSLQPWAAYLCGFVSETDKVLFSLNFWPTFYKLRFPHLPSQVQLIWCNSGIHQALKGHSVAVGIHPPNAVPL